MASVQAILCEAERFALFVIERQQALEDTENVRQIAAEHIQRVWRGYTVRKEISNWHWAATILQKYARRFLVRARLPDMYRDYVDWYRLKHYNTMAAKIQAYWRGYKYRKEGLDVKEILRKRAAIAKANEDIRAKMRPAFEQMNARKLTKMESEARRWVLYILFRLHHNLRTDVREGIYSLKGSRRLSFFEELFRSLPLQKYMDDLRVTYYAEVRRAKAIPRTYRFKSRLMNSLEDAYRNYLRNIAPKEVSQSCEAEIKRPKFQLKSKNDLTAYQREMLLGDERYSNRRFTVERSTDPAQHVSKNDFNLHTLKTEFEPRKGPPAYHIDFWEKQICEIHQLSKI